MIKKSAFIFAFTFLLAGFICPVNAEKVSIEKDVLDKILKRQEVLEKKIRKLEMKSEKAAPGAPGKDIDYLKEDVADISERLDKVETKSILDRITIGGELRSRLDSFRFKDTVASGVEDDADKDEIWSTRLRLNLKGEITDDLIFHGRLSYFKLWGTSNFDETTTDMAIPSVPRSEGDIHVERAYIDYFVPRTPLSFTFGRLPTSEGPPNELRDNTTRKATYPRLFIDAETDGITATVSLDKWTGLKNSAFRLRYSKIAQNYLEDEGITWDDSANLCAAFEMEVPGLKDSLLWLGYVRIFDLPTAEAFPEMVPYTITYAPDSGGDGGIFNAHLQLNNLMGSGLDWFGSYGFISLNPASRGTEFMGLIEMGIFGDSLNGDLGENRDGTAIYTGVRYRLPVAALKYPKIGFEYNHGSKYWLGVMSNGSGDLLNKLNVAGDAYEIYYIQPIIKDHMFCRFGGVYIDYDYYNAAPFGSLPDSDMSVTQLYLLMDVKF